MAALGAANEIPLLHAGGIKHGIDPGARGIDHSTRECFVPRIIVRVTPGYATNFAVSLENFDYRTVITYDGAVRPGIEQSLYNQPLCVGDLRVEVARKAA